jgi:PhnB protein
MGSRLNPYLAFNGNSRQAMEFYQEVFGGKLEMDAYADGGSADSPETGGLMHAQLETPDGYTLMAWDVPERVPFSPGNNVAVCVSGDDPELAGHFKKLTEGGTVTLPLAKQPWGADAGSLVDRFGINWMFNISPQHT